jgi:alkylhydroperoxidase family enzyme
MTDLAPRLAVTCNSSGFPEGTALDPLLNEFSDAVVRGFTLDPLIIEVVRLRCAQTHDCRFCSSVRFDAALDKGLDEQMAAKIARYETSDLGDAAIAALRLCDAIIMAPVAAADAELAAELRRHFTREQIAELCLHVMKWSYQKVAVSLRMEPPAASQPSRLTFGADGKPSVVGLAYQ